MRNNKRCECENGNHWYDEGYRACLHCFGTLWRRHHKTKEKTERVCKCGGIFYVQDTKTTKYCPECSVKRSRYSGREYSRSMVRERDNWACVDCGFTRTPNEVISHNDKIKGLKGRIKSLDVHHTHGMCGKNSTGYDSSKDIDRMVTLCHKCHYNRPEHKVNKKVINSVL